MSTERVFNAAELERFLRSVDGLLEAPTTIKVIGGGAAAIAYHVDIGTTDVDLFESGYRVLAPVFQRAREETGLPVPVSQPSVADVPYDCEDRLVRVLPDLRRLTVLALEKHDLALSKTVRGQENDLEALKALHERSPLDVDVLVTRYLNEMGHAHVDPRRFHQNFLMLVLRLFDDITHDRVEARLIAHRRSKEPPRRG